MKRITAIPRRLREHGPHEHGGEARLGALIRAMSEPPRLSAEAHARINRLLRMASSRKGERQWLLRRPVLAMIVMCAVVTLGIGAQASMTRAFRAGLSWIRGQRGSDERIHTWSLPRRSHPLNSPARSAERWANAAPTASSTNGELPAELGPWNERALVLPSVPLRVTRGEPEAPASPAREDPSLLAMESRLLTTALGQLRTQHDYSGALATLAEYDARFPEGVLRSEAALAKLDALTALGKTTAALGLLESMDIAGPRAAELLVLRGELRASAGRDREAVADFSRSLAGRAAPALRERALYGRASCRSRTGDRSGAASDLNDYLLEFPDGQHSAEARRIMPR